MPTTVIAVEVPKAAVITPSHRFRMLAVVLTLLDRLGWHDRDDLLKHVALQFGYTIRKVE